MNLFSFKFVKKLTIGIFSFLVIAIAGGVFALSLAAIPPKSSVALPSQLTEAERAAYEKQLETYREQAQQYREQYQEYYEQYMAEHKDEIEQYRDELEAYREQAREYREYVKELSRQ